MIKGTYIHNVKQLKEFLEDIPDETLITMLDIKDTVRSFGIEYSDKTEEVVVKAE